MQFDHVALQVPEIAGAIEWWRRTVPDTRVLHQDDSWGLVEAAGTKIALVLAHQHPSHLAWRVSEEDLERLAAEHGRPIATHRDATRSFYLEAPGGQCLEIITYPGDRESGVPAPDA